MIESINHLQYSRQTARSTISWMYYVWQSCSRKERVGISITLLISIFSIAFGATAPLFFSDIINKASGVDISILSILLSTAAFIILRFIGQAAIDLRWIMINPLLYKIVYRYGLELVERVIRLGNNSERIHRLAEVSESVIIVEKAQNSLMTLVHNFVVLVIPVIIEVIVMIVVTAFSLGATSPLLISLSVIASGTSILFFARKEAQTLANAFEADSQFYRELGHSIGLSPLINEFDNFYYFHNRLTRKIDFSVAEHNKYFATKTIRALFCSFITSLCYAAVLFSIIVGESKNLNSGHIFLILAYMDRLVIPIKNFAVAVIGIQNALIGLEHTKTLFSNFNSNSLKVKSIVNVIDNRLHVYSSCEGWPEEGVNFNKGDRILVSGLSGSGKTSLLVSIFEYIKKEHSNCLNTYYLPEKPYIFEGNIGENLSFLEDYEASAEFWNNFWGLNIHGRAPELKQSASSLSAGETQLLGFIRAIRKKPDILFVDEGLSSMDIHLESSVIKVIQESYPECIVFLVSHRTIESFIPDVIIRTSNGRVQALELSLNTSPLQEESRGIKL
jgi:ATP-binding cassette, subfamily B, bacterial